MARDLIISIFSSMSQKQLNSVGVGALSPADVQPFSKLSRSYDVVQVNKSEAGHTCLTGGVYCDTGDVWGGCCFDAIAQKYRAAGDGSLIRGMLKLKGMNPTAYEGGRIALITFSAGSTMAHHFLDSETDRNLIDTVISLDSMTFPKTASGLKPWTGYFEFAKKATGLDRMFSSGRNPYLGPMMVVMNTSIVSNSSAASSTKEAMEYLFKQLNGPYYTNQKAVGQKFIDDQAAAQKELQSRVRQAVDQLPLPLTVGASGATKTFTRDNAYPQTWGYLGNLWQLGYSGNGPADHFFAAYVAQKFILESFLIPRWNSSDVAIAGLGGFGFGAGDAIEEHGVTFTTPGWWQRGGGLVNKGAIGGYVMPGGLRIALGLGFGVGVGYALTKLLRLDK